MKKISIIILNWNGKDLTRNCLNSVKKHTKYKNYEIIVLDQGSKDGSIKMLEKKFPYVKLIKNKTNVGFGKGSNQVMKIAKGDYFFLLSNDTLVTSGWLENTVKIMEFNNRIASIGSTLISPNEVNYQQKAKDIEKDTVCGAAMLMRRKAIERVGFFDTKNFSPAYGEETDWNYRARRAGYKIVETKRSIVAHIGSVTAKRLPNTNQYILLNTHRLKAMLYNDSMFSFLKRIPGLGLIFLTSFGEKNTHLLLKSYWNNIKNFKNIMKERKKRKKLLKKIKAEQKEIGEEWF